MAKKVEELEGTGSRRVVGTYSVRKLDQERVCLRGATGERSDCVPARKEEELRTLVPDIAVSGEPTVGRDPELFLTSVATYPPNTDCHSLRLAAQEDITLDDSAASALLGASEAAFGTLADAESGGCPTFVEG
jgi:hypothetical protein